VFSTELRLFDKVGLFEDLYTLKYCQSSVYIFVIFVFHIFGFWSLNILLLVST
jgi:hypothetical protein